MRSRAAILAVILVLLLTTASSCPMADLPAENQCPVAGFSCAPTTGESPLTVAFDASSSYDPDGSIVSHHWSFGDGSSGSGESISHEYSTTTSRSFVAVLTVLDDAGASDTQTISIYVRAAASSPAPSAPCKCSGPDLNCPDFATHASAQACYDYCQQQGYGDVFRLDADNDGLACESLP